MDSHNRRLQSTDILDFTTIVLPQEMRDQFRTYARQYGEDYAQHAIRIAQAEAYIAARLDCFSRNVTNNGRCLTTGVEKYRRQDNGLLDEGDRAALRALDRGQSNVVEIESDGATATYRWVCDSSD